MDTFFKGAIKNAAKNPALLALMIGLVASELGRMAKAGGIKPDSPVVAAVHGVVDGATQFLQAVEAPEGE